MTAKFVLFAGIVLGAIPLGARIPLLMNPIPFAVTLDSNGNEYSIGTNALGVVVIQPTPGGAQTQPGGGTCFHNTGIVGSPLGPGQSPEPCYDVEIVKRDPSGNVVFATLLGGSKDDIAQAIAIDASGFIYVAGSTGGAFPVTPGAALTAIPSNGNFAAKLSPDGRKVIYATYLPSPVGVAAIAADANGNAYVTGGGQDGHAVVLKINADGSTFLYNRSISIAQFESGTAIAVDANGDAVVAGWTRQNELPRQSVFIAKLNANGAITATTVLSSTGVDIPSRVAMDGAGNIYVAGSTTSLDLPVTPGVFQEKPLVPLWANAPGGFVAKLAADLSVVYATYVPTLVTGDFRGVAQLAPGSAGDVYIAGSTGPGFPVTNSAQQPCFFQSGTGSAFVAHLNAAGALADASYANGSGVAGMVTLSNGFLEVDTEPADPLTKLSMVAFHDPPGPCLSPLVLHGATFVASNVAYLAAGEFVTLTGFGIGPESGVGASPDAQGHLPISLGGVQVMFNGKPAPLLYAQSRQINTQVPFDLAGQLSTDITVTFNNRTFGPISAPLYSFVQGIFRKQPGISADAVATNEDGTVNSPAKPAPIGTIVSLWGTGFGIAPGCSVGGFNPLGADPLGGAWPSISAESSVPAIDYLGGAPTFLCGIEQINIRIPINATPGPYPVGESPSSIVYVK